MSTDWGAVEWWDMPGPARFVEKVAEHAVGHASGVTSLLLPNPRPAGLVEAVLARIKANSAILVTKIDAASGLRGRSPTTLLANSVGVVARVRTVEDFLDSPEMAGRIFVLDGIPPEDWESWAFFLRFFRTERTRKGSLLRPALLILPPVDTPPDEIRAATGTEFRYLGAVSRLDTELYAERTCAWPDDSLLSRTRVSVIVELSGWDPSMVRALADMEIEDQLDPRTRLSRLQGIGLAEIPSWSNGRVDQWDGAPFVHTACLLRSEHDLAARLWRAHVRTVFPFLNHVRRSFAARYDSLLRSQLPITKTFHTRVITYEQPHQLELHDVTELLKGYVSSREISLLEMCKTLRRQMAHSEPGSAVRIVRASELWDEICDDFQSECNGWDWPRCGQRLILVVGPSGAGKSRWAERNREPSEVFSSDRIREQIYGKMNTAGDPRPVFRELRRLVMARVASGKSAVIDATNIARDDRLANVRLMPQDMYVDYVVIDRPMSEKHKAAELWPDSCDFLVESSILFANNLPDILAGDNLYNVNVIDLRQTDES